MGAYGVRLRALVNNAYWFWDFPCYVVYFRFIKMSVRQLLRTDGLFSCFDKWTVFLVLVLTTTKILLLKFIICKTTRFSAYHLHKFINTKAQDIWPVSMFGAQSTQRPSRKLKWQKIIQYKSLLNAYLSYVCLKTNCRFRLHISKKYIYKHVYLGVTW